MQELTRLLRSIKAKELLTQQEIARECGVSQSAVSRVLSGRSTNPGRARKEIELWVRGRSEGVFDNSQSSDDFEDVVARLKSMPRDEEGRRALVSALVALETLFGKAKQT